MERFFIITIDTEGDNIWKRVITRSGMREIEVENAKYIERFQILCNKYNFIPTYLVNYEMAKAEVFVGQTKEWIQDKQCEIGMHMHAWNTPPIYDLPYNRKGHNPFAGEYPRKVLWKKMQIITDTLEKEFQVKPVSHRGGRWYTDSWYMQALVRLGYRVDCSITSGITWEKTIGNTMYGPDYRKYPTSVFAIEKNGICKNINKMKSNSILEIPPTIINTSLRKKAEGILKNPANICRTIHEKIWLRPNGCNLDEMLYLVEHTQKNEYIEFMLHSSELMPGGSPAFKTKQSIEKLYYDLEILFSEIGKRRKGISLTGYGSKILGRKRQ